MVKSLQKNSNMGARLSIPKNVSHFHGGIGHPPPPLDQTVPKFYLP